MTEQIRQTKEYLQYDYTEQELAALSQEMAQAVNQHSEAELQLKEVSTQIKAEIAGFAGMVNDRANKIRQRYEYRNVDCEVKSDPETGMIHCWRKDYNTVVWEREMDEHEMQGTMPLESEPVNEVPTTDDEAEEESGLTESEADMESALGDQMEAELEATSEQAMESAEEEAAQPEKSVKRTF